MSSYLRPRIPGACVFFTVNLAQRGSRLLVEEIMRLRVAVRATAADHPFYIDAWVVLPDHMHAVWTLPGGDHDFSTRWRLIKGRFAHGLNAKRRSASKMRAGEKGIWQRRFWEHHIRCRADYDAHIRYCWENPVKHGFVRHAVHWPYSSIHRDVKLGRVAPEWALDGALGA